MAKQRFFLYGWFMVAVAWVCYGFGISPAYYSWGVFAPSLIEDLGYDRGRFGAIAGLFTLVYSCVGPLVGISQSRYGIRATMVTGFTCTAIGLLITSRADTPIEFYLGFSILGGAGIGFATIIPCQTLGQNWFLRRRALAIAIIFTSGGIVGKIVAKGDIYILENYDWRTGWFVVACISATLAVFAALFVRDSPEKIGQHPDGIAPDKTPDSGSAPFAPT